MQITITQMAELCHSLNKVYCHSIGDHSQPSWKDAPDWQKQSAMNGVKFHINNPMAGADASHKNWLMEKEEQGWKYGAVKDSVVKEHPCFVPFEQLPPEQQMKDHLFRGVVHAIMDSQLGVIR